MRTTTATGINEEPGPRPAAIESDTGGRHDPTDAHPWGQDPWPTRDDALEAAGLIAVRARNLYGDLLDSVWLYGSRARGDHGPASDLDVLLVTTSRDPQDHLRGKLGEELRAEHFDPGIWNHVSLHTAYDEQVREWDTMFFRNVRADAVQVVLPGRKAASPAHFPSEPSIRGRASGMTATKEAFELLAEAGKVFVEAEGTLRMDFYRVSVSLAYYAAFRAAQAVVAYHREGPKTHKGVNKRFHDLAVKSSDFPADIGGYLGKLMKGRVTADYHVTTARDWTEAQASDAIEKARTFVGEVTAWFDRHHVSFRTDT